MTPASRNTPSKKASSSPSFSEAVCAMAACFASLDEPTLMTTTGLKGTTARHAVMNASGESSPSTYTARQRVLGSLPP